MAISLLLAFLRSASEQDNGRFAVPSEIETVAGTKINSVFMNAFRIGKVSIFHAGHRDSHLGSGDVIETANPGLVWPTSAFIGVRSQLDQNLSQHIRY